MTDESIIVLAIVPFVTEFIVELETGIVPFMIELIVAVTELDIGGAVDTETVPFMTGVAVTELEPDDEVTITVPFIMGVTEPDEVKGTLEVTP